MKNKYKYILFDWDGCLAKTLDIWLRVYKELCVERGIKIGRLNDFEIVEKSFGKWAPGLANLGIKDADVAYKEAVDKVMVEYGRVNLYPNAENTLLKLKNKNKKLALLSSSFRAWIDKPLKYRHFNKYFDFIIGRDEVKNGKPDPEQIFRAMDNLDADKQSTLIIGDSDHDIKAGHAANICTVLYYPVENHRFYSEEFLREQNPNYVIDNLLDLIKIIN